MMLLLQDGDVSVTESRFEFLNAPPLWTIILLIIPAVVLLVGYVYRAEAESATPKVKRVLAGFRMLVLLVVLLVLFQPVNRSQVFSVHRSIVALLIDKSASMDRPEEYEDDLGDKLAKLAGLTSASDLATLTRADLVKLVLDNPENRYLERLEEKVEIHSFSFDSSLYPVVDPLAGDSDGEATALGDAVLSAINELRHKGIELVIAVTDGQNNRGRDPREVARLAEAEGVPIYTVGVGNPSEPHNVAIVSVDAPDVALVHDQVAVEVTLVSQGYDGDPAEIIITERNSGERLGEPSSFTLSGDGRQQTETLYFKPEREGEYELLVSIPEKSGEQFVDDNKVVHHLQVKPEVIRVLYVEGRPRWEYRYLKNLLLRAENFKVQCLLVSAAPDFIQESSEGVPALLSFPPNRKTLFEYDVVILGDVAPDKIDSERSRGSTEELLRELHEFVTFGGGLIMVAGQLHSPRDYRDSPVSDLLPVEIGSPEDAEAEKSDHGSFRPRMPDPLSPHPVVRFETDLQKNRDLIEDDEFGLPPMRWYGAVRRPKPGAEVILQHPVNSNQYGPHVLVCTTRIPRGRSMYVGFDETWLWRNPYGDRYIERFWRSAVRHVAIGKLRSSDRRFDLRTDKERYNLRESIEVSVRVFDEDFMPSRDEQQLIKIQRGERPVEEVLVYPKEAGFFERTLRADVPGTYRLWIEDASQGDKRLSQRTVEVQIPQLEILNPTLDRAGLAEMAQLSGGRFHGLHEFGLLVENMTGQSRRIPVRTEQQDLWDRSWIILLIVGLLTVEWAARKHYNLL